jgi:hypothetical protein
LNEAPDSADDLREMQPSGRTSVTHHSPPFRLISFHFSPFNILSDGKSFI